jgi:hypothetical protein
VNGLEIVPLDFAEANELVARWHRHHRPVPGMKFAIGVAKNGEVVGAAIVSRPTARMSDNGWTVEVVRCVTDGTKNACSKLYGACARVAIAMGYKRVITYTLPEEGGASLRGSGWRCVGEAGGGKWSRVNRPRVDLHPTQTKLLWEMAS